jgi:hypothetical protein
MGTLKNGQLTSGKIHVIPGTDTIIAALDAMKDLIRARLKLFSDGESRNEWATHNRRLAMTTKRQT